MVLRGVYDHKPNIEGLTIIKLVSGKQKNILTCIETLGHIKQTKWDQTRCWYRILFID